MQSEHIEDDLLQRYFDGELAAEPHAEAEIRGHLSGCSECEQRHQALGRLHSMFQIAAEEMADSASFAGLYERIEQGIEEDRQAGGQNSPVGGFRRFIADLLGKRSQVWMPVTGAAVAAAAVLLTIFTSPGSESLPSGASSDGLPLR